MVFFLLLLSILLCLFCFSFSSPAGCNFHKDWTCLLSHFYCILVLSEQTVICSSVFPLSTLIHLRFSFVSAVSSRALRSLRCSRAVARLIMLYLSTSLPSFVPLDHTASSQTNPVFVQGFLICADQDCTRHKWNCPKMWPLWLSRYFQIQIGLFRVVVAVLFFVVMCRDLSSLMIRFDCWKLLSHGFLQMLISTLLFRIVLSERCAMWFRALLSSVVSDKWVFVIFTPHQVQVLCLASRGQCNQTGCL